MSVRREVCWRSVRDASNECVLMVDGERVMVDGESVVEEEEILKANEGNRTIKTSGDQPPGQPQAS